MEITQLEAKLIVPVVEALLKDCPLASYNLVKVYDETDFTSSDFANTDPEQLFNMNFYVWNHMYQE